MFELLSAPIRKYVRDKRWEALRPIQNAAIQHIVNSDKHIILASKTASGKTEAAFLPILSVLDYHLTGVKVLYISPLIALINDQFARVEDLCKDLEFPVTKWHGEAKKSLKEKLIKTPDGVVLITPESIEAMLTNAPQNVRTLFSNLQFVVIDEIHSFIGTDRGVQLHSLISRLNDIHQKPAAFRVIGLSATIGDFQEAKKITGRPDHTVVLRDKTSSEMQTEFKYFEMKGVDLPPELIDSLYENTKNQKVLIFPNSRGRVEEVAVRLKKLSERKKGHPYYFSHHSSIDKELREYIENFAKHNTRFPFAIACTSTLELGIDIGSVEAVAQIDATHSISSLIQRVGRSGRQADQQSSLLFYATDPWSLLQSLACMALFKEGFIEPVSLPTHPYDILAHQLLSIVKQRSGTTYGKLENELQGNYAFEHIPKEDMAQITKELLRQNQLEQIGSELIIGIDGEYTVNGKDFYSVFKTDPSFKVIHHDKTIGELPLMSTVQADENILLAARIWKILEIDIKAKKIFVSPAKDGKKPIFFGAGGEVHPKIREKMLQLLSIQTDPVGLDPAAEEAMRQLQLLFKHFPIKDLSTDRPVLIKHSDAILYTFQGTKINRSLQFLLKLAGIEFDYNEHHSSFTFATDLSGLKSYLEKAISCTEKIDQALEESLTENPGMIEFAKWGGLLPLKYQRLILQAKYFDFPGTMDFFRRINLMSSSKT